MTTNNKFSRLASIGAMPEAAPEQKQEEPIETTAPVAAIEQIEPEDTIIYRLVAELEQDDLDKFLDYKYKLTSTYGACSNKDVVHEMLAIVYNHILDISPRPKSVRMRELTYSRKAVKRTKR